MRDPKRIPIILSKIETLWSAMPDMRFVQLISNLVFSISYDPYYLEDDKFLELVEKNIMEQQLGDESN